MAKKVRPAFVAAIVLVALLGVIALIVGVALGPAPVRDAAERGDAGAEDGEGGGAALGGGRASRAAAVGDAGIARARTEGERGLPIRLSPAAVAQDPVAVTGAIEGRVVSVSTNRGVAGATLEWARDDATVSVRSGADGTFSFLAPDSGSYVLAVVSADGFLPYAPEWGHSPLVFDARPGTRVRDVVLYLTPAIEYVGVVLAVWCTLLAIGSWLDKWSRDRAAPRT